MRPTREQWKEMLSILREVRGFGHPTGVRLSDGTLWGSYRSEARDEIIMSLPTYQGAEDVWRGKPVFVKAPCASDWNPMTRKWSWEA